MTRSLPPERKYSQSNVIGFRSPFAEWKICIDGLAVFYSGEDAASRMAFDMLRADSVCREVCTDYSTSPEGRFLDSGGEDEAKGKSAEGASRIPGPEKHLSLFAMRENWETLLAKHPMAQSPKAKARIRLHMGLLALGFFREESGNLSNRDAIRNRGLHLADLFRARRDIEASLRLDEGCLAAWKALAEVLELSGERSDLNRHMVRMADCFPDDGATQEKLALDCASRSAFGKSLRYLDKARALNPLDLDLVRLETVIRIEKAFRCFFCLPSGNPRSFKQGRRAFRDALASVEAGNGRDPVFGGRNWVLLHWYLVECRVGEEAGSRAVRGQWDISSPLPLYFAAFHLAAQWRLRPQQEEFKDLFSQVLNRTAAPEDVEGLILFWKEWQASRFSPYTKEFSGGRDRLPALLEHAFVDATPSWVFLPMLRHMYDTLGEFAVTPRLCAHLLKWHPQDFVLRCLQELNAFIPVPAILRDLKKEAQEKGEKEWAARLDARDYGSRNADFHRL